MKTLFYLSLFQLILSAIAAWLISKMSFFGKLGIGLFYSEYKILKSPVETGIVIFGIQIALLLLLFILNRFTTKKITTTIAIIILLMAAAGLGYTIYDFTYEFSHRILKTKFHIGFYLIWIGMMVSSVVYLLKPGRNMLTETRV